MDEGCTQPLSSDPKINLNTTVFSFSIFSRLRGISTIWSLSPLQLRSQRKHRVRLGRATHTRLNHSTIMHTSEKVSTQTQHEEFTTQIVLKSQERRSDCVKAKSRSPRMLRMCLLYSSMHLGVPFIAPRQLGAVGDQLGRPSLPSVEWRTGQVL
jgi:hypothetical protein